MGAYLKEITQITLLMFYAWNKITYVTGRHAYVQFYFTSDDLMSFSLVQST